MAHVVFLVSHRRERVHLGSSFAISYAHEWCCRQGGNIQGHRLRPRHPLQRERSTPLQPCRGCARSWKSDVWKSLIGHKGLTDGIRHFDLSGRPLTHSPSFSISVNHRKITTRNWNQVVGNWHIPILSRNRPRRRLVEGKYKLVSPRYLWSPHFITSFKIMSEKARPAGWLRTGAKEMGGVKLCRA